MTGRCLKALFIAMLLLLASPLVAGDQLVLARLKYQGGGDWYNDPSILPNLAREIKKRTPIDVFPYEKVVELTDEDLFRYPFIFMTGHGRIFFNQVETENLRRYLLAGGFLYADYDFGMDKFFREEIMKVLPEYKLTPLPYDLSLFRVPYLFSSGAPKIHKHSGGAPETFGIFDEKGRLMVLYTFNTNISDGWASPNIHKDPPGIRELAFRMGVNIITYVLTH